MVKDKKKGYKLLVGKLEFDEEQAKFITELMKYKLFYMHIEKHLNKDEKVICKICGKNIEEVLSFR